ncbi:MAG: hypothetical protein FWG34_05465 [Oscillospiraceae bacterium]|nr:hypothetical protein [Oscillospiraceae bacterium]
MNKHKDRICPLGGIWKIICDPENAGKEKNWQSAFPETEAIEISVPGQAQAVYPGQSGVFWYFKSIVPEVGTNKSLRAFLRFQAVDYRCEAWIGGRFIGEHEGGETPFEFEVTGILKKDMPNNLVLRIVVPKDDKAVDGLLLREIPSGNKREGNYQPGSPNNYGGIMRKVELIARPAVFIKDAYITACPHTGKVAMEITVDSALKKAAKIELTASLSPRWQNAEAARTSIEAKCVPKTSIYKLNCTVEHPQLWELDNPMLYTANIQLIRKSKKQKSRQKKECLTDTYSARIGFRELKVEQGYFVFNGRRIYLKTSHTGGDIPLFHLNYMKTAGFNMIRAISGNMNPDLLDYCDDIGLMVYEEHKASWLLGDSADASANFERSLLETVRRDRSRACLVIIGLLNETPDNDAFNAALNALPKLRELDMTRLVLLSSGRWDFNMRIGSLSNPFSEKFECAWGEEDPNHPLEKTKMDDLLNPMPIGAGDIHIYPRMPMTWEAKETMLNLGKGGKPIFLSEFGAGSQLNTLSDYSRARQSGGSLNTPEMLTTGFILESIKKDWERFGLEGIYPSIDDFFTDSFVKSVRQRIITFDLARGNPKFCGYNLTGLMDHALTGEGLWTVYGELKPGMMEALRDGWDPLRFCMFVEPGHAYTNKPLRIIVRLANEDALRPGLYPINLRIWKKEGICWEKKTQVVIQQGKFAPLAYTVFDETINVSLEAGEYTLAADMDEGGRPGNRRMKFTLTDKNSIPAISGQIFTLAQKAPYEDILKSAGAGVSPYDFESQSGENGEVIVVGDEGDIAWDLLYDRIRRGARALFLSPFVFSENGDSTAKLPLAQKSGLRRMRDWLYHKEYIGRHHPALEGMQGPGILDWEYYGQLCNDYFFEGIQTPDDVAVVCMASGCPGPGYDGGVAIGGYRLGEGFFMLNTMGILENAGHPAADRLLANLVNYMIGKQT